MSFEKHDILRRRVSVGGDDYPEGAVRLGAESVDATALSDRPITDLAVLRVLDGEGRPMEGFTYHVQNHSAGGMIVRVYHPQDADQEKISNCTAVPSGLPIGEGSHIHAIAAFAVIVDRVGRVEVAGSYGLDDWSLILLANPAPEHHGEVLFNRAIVTGDAPIDVFFKSTMASDQRLMTMSNPHPESPVEVRFKQQESTGGLSEVQQALAKSLVDGFSWITKAWAQNTPNRLRGLYLHTHKGKKPKRGWQGKHPHRHAARFVELHIDFDARLNRYK